ncbi:MAG: DUF445 family protein [Clostridia bacterium]|nr:DUF445 family protein [Clostridia bacterium]
MTFLEVLQLISGPLLGAVIGVFTNYIAVKMLFRPYHAHYIGKWHIPFTPGIMPRRQKALGKALGHAISESLVRREDLEQALLSDEVSKTVARAVLALPSIEASGTGIFGEEKYEDKREEVLDALTDRILAGVQSFDLGAIITAEATAAIRGYTSKNPLLGMFVNDNLIASLTAPIVEKVAAFLEGEGREKVRDKLEQELEPYEQKPIRELITDTEKFETVLIALYRHLVEKHAYAVVSHFHIEQMVEEKIEAMPPKELEALVLSVMKKELNAVIWLGAGIGFVIGLINIGIDFITKL